MPDTARQTASPAAIWSPAETLSSRVRSLGIAFGISTIENTQTKYAPSQPAPNGIRSMLPGIGLARQK